MEDLNYERRDQLIVITLRKITLDNRRTIFNLEVAEEQQKYVASNLSSVASCFVLATNGGSPSSGLQRDMNLAKTYQKGTLNEKTS